MGAEFIEENRGAILAVTRKHVHIWRALFELAKGAGGKRRRFWNRSRFWSKSSALDPADHQSVREYLLALYLAVEDLRGAETPESSFLRAANRAQCSHGARSFSTY